MLIFFIHALNLLRHWVLTYLITYNFEIFSVKTYENVKSVLYIIIKVNVILKHIHMCKNIH